MTNLKTRYTELVALTQLFLFKEHSLKDVRISSPASYAFFQPWLTQLARQAPLKKSAPPVTFTPKQAYSPPPRPQQTVPSPDPQPTPPNPSPPSPDPAPPSIPPEHPLPPAKPPEIVQKKPVINASPSFLNLEPFSTTHSLQDEAGFKQILKQTFPQYALCETIPDDSTAKKLKNAWSLEQLISPVILLSFDGQDKHLTFLKNIARAISLRWMPAKVLSGLKLEKEKQWDAILNTSHLRLVIASDYGLYLQPGLMKHYKTDSKSSKHFIHQTPLLLLSDIDLYLKDPQLKALLWRAICNEFA